MKQVVLSPRTGVLEVADVPVPQIRPGAVLVRNTASVVSVGTERFVLDMAGRSLAGKARARPDLVREVLNKVRRDGLRTTVRETFIRLDSPQPLGYSCAGVVVDAGAGVDGFRPGDRVACAGTGWAAHAEVVLVPRQLCVPLPAEVTDEAGAFATLGAIALHGVRRAGAGLGEVVAVLGLGIVGQLTVQLLRSAGCRVVAYDVVPARVKLAGELGADAAAVTADDARAAAIRITGGLGVDAVIVTASTASSAPVALAADLARVRGTVVMVGTTGMDVPRRPFWKKELALVLSKASGPGSEDETYERRGVAFPAPYVRWTAGRNMAAFVGELASGRVRVEPLVTHRFPIERAGDAYDLISGRAAQPHLGVVLTYPAESDARRTIALRPAPRRAGGLRIGVIGGGVFARTVLLPALRGVPGVRLRAVATATGLSARHVGDRLGFEVCTTDPRAVLDDDQVDAVVVATRHDLHASLAADALRAGKHVFVEKPLALTAEDVRAVVAAYTASPRTLMVGFNRRYSPIVRILKDFVGAVRPLVLTYRVNAGAIPADHWTYDPVEGGGRWLGEGGHFVDLLQYLTDAEPVEVFARSVGPAGAASLVISLAFRDGSAGTIAYVDGADRALFRERLDVFGAGVACTLDDFRRATLARGGRVRQVRRLEAERGHREELRAWVAAAAGSASSPVPLETYVANAACCFAVAESVRTGRPVAVDAAALLRPPATDATS
ncbi:MAG TPA: bi-domain-containing oxidoreductase [bacterium]|nr:bi-domain-containing oxidoreductase [bacterium]